MKKQAQSIWVILPTKYRHTLNSDLFGCDVHAQALWSTRKQAWLGALGPTETSLV